MTSPNINIYCVQLLRIFKFICYNVFHSILSMSATFKCVIGQSGGGEPT